ncbi:apolipoprotein D-like [Anopheles bellator]|uniref:apolipoprotein D-like n=1 Tax=Anopheles bellator TaxID=139047 RepID=UPI002648C02A|nr:apolipoprotein D-like [Anopheles bellator]
MDRIASWTLLAVCFSAAVGTAHGVLYTKTCLKFEEQYTFKEEKFAGKWYEIRRLYDPSDPEQEDCVVMQYRLGPEGSFTILQSFQITDEGKPIYRSGKAEPRVFHESRVPQFYERFNTTSAADPDTSIDIIATDYASYAIVYSCTPFNATHHLEASWVLSRQPALEKTDVDLVDHYLQSRFHREDHKWRATQQTPEFCKKSLVEDAAPDSGALRTLSTHTVLLVSLATLLGTFLS